MGGLRGRVRKLEREMEMVLAAVFETMLSNLPGT